SVSASDSPFSEVGGTIYSLSSNYFSRKYPLSRGRCATLIAGRLGTRQSDLMQAYANASQKRATTEPFGNPPYGRCRVTISTTALQRCEARFLCKLRVDNENGISEGRALPSLQNL